MRRKSGDQTSPRDAPETGMCSMDATPDNAPKENQNALPISTLTSLWERCFECGVWYLHISPIIKITYYFITLVIFTAIQESESVPHFEILTGKYSILNQVFVKQGWGFTLGSYVLFQLLCISLQRKSHWSISLRRLAVGLVITTFFFFIWCQVIFPGVEYATSACTSQNIRVNLGKRECLRRKNYVYHSFDISGHSYLLIYCVLVLMEESKSILCYLQLGRYLRGEPPEGGSTATTIMTHSTEDTSDYNKNDLRKSSWTRPRWTEPSEADANLLRSLYPITSPLLIISFLFMVFLALLWDFMLIITTIYYHTFPEKVLGTFLAVGMWHLIYGRIFPLLASLRFFTPDNKMRQEGMRGQ